MLIEALIWLYFLNALALMLHEIDSAYWNEWKLFNLSGGMNGFLVFNLAAIVIVLYGFMEIVKATSIGIWFSILLGLIGIFTFGIHMYFIGKGKNEFKVPFSIAILVSTLVVSIAEIILAVYALM